MAGYTLLAFRDVLGSRPAGESPAAATPVTAGRMLYHGIRQYSPLLLVLDEEAEHHALVDHWLHTHGYRNHVAVLINPRPDAPAEGRAEVVAAARRMGALDLAVDADPQLAARMVHLGVSSLLLSVPAYTRPEFRPDASRVGRSWSVITEELDAQLALREGDNRLADNVQGTRFEDE